MKKKEQKKTTKTFFQKYRHLLLICFGIVAVCILLFFVRVYGLITAPDTQCTRAHIASEQMPINPSTSKDFYDLGNYDYDIGDCTQAIIEYTKSITLDPSYPQAWNNRGYTYLRMQNYEKALSDFNKALTLNPDYVRPLMNRGDIHNYYIIDRKAAIADYDHIIKLGKTAGTSVCGHKAMVQTNNMLPLAFLNLFLIMHFSCSL